MIGRPSENEYDPYFSRYISLVPDGNFLDLLGAQTQDTRTYFESLNEETGNYRYAEGKWSIKEVLGHVIDAERVFAYRALCVARGETQNLPGYDQDDYARVSEWDRIPLARVVQQYTALRVSTFYMLEQFSETAWNRVGLANQKPSTARSLAYIIAGHERHHMNVLSSLYGQPTKPPVN